MLKTAQSSLSINIKGAFTLLVGVFIFLSQLPVSISAQNSNGILFHGRVFDRVSNAPVDNVNFVLQRNNHGTVSNSRGEFSLYSDSIPSVLIVSHIGYVTKKVILDSSSCNMMLYLDPDIIQLREAVIRAVPFEIVFKNDHYSVLDYETDSSNIYLLIYRNRLSRSELILINFSGDTLASSGLLPYASMGLHKDCLGAIHILSRDSAYQVFRESKSLLWFDPVLLTRYLEIVGDCITSTPTQLFIKRTTDFELGTEFFIVDRSNHDIKLITQVRDEKMINMLRKNPEDFWMLQNASPPNQDGKMSESVGEVKSANISFVEWNWVKKVVYLPVRSFLYMVGELICVFNIPNLQVEFFNVKGDFSYKTGIGIRPDTPGKWTKDILFDEITSNVYTSYINNGILTLYKIDLNSGELIKEISSYYSFPQNVKVYGNYLYYLYDDPVQPDNKMLFRQRIR